MISQKILITKYLKQITYTKTFEMKKIIYLSFLLFLITCSVPSDNKPFVFNDFPNTIHLKSEDIVTPPILYYVGQMIATDSLLIIFDMKAKNYITAFKLNNFQYFGSFLGRGRGPEEETQIDPFIHPTSDNSFIYSSFHAIKEIRINLQKNILETLKEIRLPSSITGFSHLFVLNDSLYYGWDIYQEGTQEFIAYNPNSHEASEFGPKYPNIIKEIPKTRMTSIYTKCVTVKPDRLLFASAYDKFKMIRIYNNDGSLYSEIHYGEIMNLPREIVIGDLNNIDLDKVIVYYQRIYSTDKYIYALYSGKSMVDIQNSGKPDICNEIHVWNWEGKPVAKIILDRNVSSFVVSSNNQYIVCSSQEDINKLYKYKIDMLRWSKNGNYARVLP